MFYWTSPYPVDDHAEISPACMCVAGRAGVRRRLRRPIQHATWASNRHLCKYMYIYSHTDFFA